MFWSPKMVELEAMVVMEVVICIMYFGTDWDGLLSV